MKRVILLAFSLILSLFLIGSLSGLHFKLINAIPGNVQIVRSNEIGDYARAVLFEDKTDMTFGVAKIEKRLGFLYRYGGGTRGYMVEDGKPFRASGIGDSNDSLIAIKTARNSNIKYIALGNHMEGVSPLDQYELTLYDVKENIDSYYLKEVIDNYVIFVLDEYNEDVWTIRAFNETGKLVADQLFSGDPRYVDWE